VYFRPLSTKEKQGECGIIDMDDKKVNVKNPSSNMKKTFCCDRVFAEASTQLEVFEAVVSPAITEVIVGVVKTKSKQWQF